MPCQRETNAYRKSIKLNHPIKRIKSAHNTKTHNKNKDQNLVWNEQKTISKCLCSLVVTCFRKFYTIHTTHTHNHICVEAVKEVLDTDQTEKSTNTQTPKA